MSSRLSATMREALTQFNKTGDFAGFRASTVQALVKRDVVSQTADGISFTERGREIASEIIGKPRTNKLEMRSFSNEMSHTATMDWGQADYSFYDRLSHAQVPGLELAGLLIKPLASKKSAWTLGLPPKIKLDQPKAEERFSEWWMGNQADIIRGYEESSKLGDVYLVINPPDADGNVSVTILPPNVIEPLVDEDNYSEVIGWRVTEVHPHPLNHMDKMRIVDEYTKSKRVRKTYKNDHLMKTKTYRNLLGRIPIIHIPNNAGSDERFGHPDSEALLPALYKYDEAFQYALMGHKKMGRPTPVIEKMGSVENVDKFWELFGETESYTDENGDTRHKQVLNINLDDLLTLGGTAQFSYESPGSFTKDTSVLLELLFYLILQHTEFPEFIWGNAIASSKASAEAQMPAFTRFIEMCQLRCHKWMTELVQIVCGYYALFETGISGKQTVSIKWQPLTGADGQMTLQAIELGLRNGLLDRETALNLMPLDIENPREILDKVDAEKEAARQRFEDNMGDFNNQQDIEDQGAPTDDEEDDDPAQTTDEMADALSAIVSEQQTGVTLAFFLDVNDASKLYEATARAGVKQPTPPEDMHLTLTMLGDMKEVDIERDALQALVMQFAQTQAPIQGVVSGVGRFQNNDDDTTEVIYASFDSPSLPAFRQALVEMLGDNDLEVVSNHGFTPHITLSYIPADAPTPNIRLPQTELTFDRLILAWGEQHLAMRLGVTEAEAV